jgi:hypothetical protein
MVSFASHLTTHYPLPTTLSPFPFLLFKMSSARCAGDEVQLSKSNPRQMRGEERRVERTEQLLPSSYSTNENALPYMEILRQAQGETM